MVKTVVVVAGGQGIRMGSGLPKQFLMLGGRPILMHTMDLFHNYDPGAVIILGLGSKHLPHWKKLCREMGFDIPHRITPGGETRFHTVQNALQEVPEGSVIAIHDGVRPLVSTDTIDRCFKEALKSGTAIPCVDVPGSLREIKRGKSSAVDRKSFCLVQTPQVFLYDIIKRAYRQDYNEAFTDDASVVEKSGHPVSLVSGNSENIKITTPGDLIYAESLIGHFRK